jgi:hypothetical protein
MGPRAVINMHVSPPLPKILSSRRYFRGPLTCRYVTHVPLQTLLQSSRLEIDAPVACTVAKVAGIALQQQQLLFKLQEQPGNFVQQEHPILQHSNSYEILFSPTTMQACLSLPEDGFRRHLLTPRPNMSSTDKLRSSSSEFPLISMVQTNNWYVVGPTITSCIA